MRILYPFFSLLMLLACRPDQKEHRAPTMSAQDEKSVVSKWSADEQAVIDASEELLFHVGNYNHRAMAKASLPDANVGLAGSGRSITLQDYFDLVNERPTLLPYYEPPHRYSIEISKGKLAFVRAKCFLYRFGVKQNFEDNFFVFIKVQDQWKLLSASFTAEKLSEEKQIFDLEAFARSYAQVWGSTRPEFVAMFFDENGTIRVNEGSRSTGRKEIATFAQSFMTDIPDMRVLFDSLVTDDNKTEFHWTLIGTHAATGNRVNVSGFEEWTLSEENLVSESQGHFPSDIYEDQIKNGTAN